MLESNEEAQGALEDRKVEFYACLLEPGKRPAQDAVYTGTRRLLLCRKARAGQLQRQTWKCNGRGYVAYREYLRQCKHWENSRPTSPSSYPGDSGRWSSSLAPGFDRTSWTSRGRPSISSGPRSHGSAAESEVPLHNHIEPAYSFVGMHCIFDDIKASETADLSTVPARLLEKSYDLCVPFGKRELHVVIVTSRVLKGYIIREVLDISNCIGSVNVLRFGHLSSDLLAFGAADGSLVVCSVANPPSILHHLKGHLKEVTDFDWTLNNQYLCSSSFDKSVRVWSVEKGSCLRVIYGRAAQLCIRFHPLNNNFLLVGHADQGLTVINFSTGRTLQRLSVERNITAMDVSSNGHILFAGDAEGCVHSIKVDLQTGALSHKHRTTKGLHRRSPTTTVQFKNFSRLAGGPVLLVANQDGSLRFFSVALEVDGYLSLKCSLKLPPLARNIRASFCPLLSLESGEFIVTGNEDTNVYFYDFTRPKHPCVNKLQVCLCHADSSFVPPISLKGILFCKPADGHSVPAVGVAWNHGENLLATSDCEGVVIVWKRARDTS